MNDLIRRQAAYDTLTEYYHHKTDIQHKALAEALSRVPSLQNGVNVQEVRYAIAKKLGIGKECNKCQYSSDPYCMWKPNVVDVCEAIWIAPTESDTISRSQTCEYCQEDSDGYVRPIEKNGHVFVRNGMNGRTLSLKANGWHGEASIKFCPMCGRKL